MEIIVNEWLLEYLRPNTSREKRNYALRFIKAWENKIIKVVIRRPSPFLQKLQRYWQKSNEDESSYYNYKRISRQLYDSDKTVIVDDNDIKNLPAKLEDKTPSDDKYLIELAYTEPSRLIVTTDSPLKQKLHGEAEIKICLLDDFLSDYLIQS